MRDSSAAVHERARARRVRAHLHPRNRWGEETLDPEVIDATVREVRQACGVPVGVSTGASESKKASAASVVVPFSS